MKQLRVGLSLHPVLAWMSSLSATVLFVAGGLSAVASPISARGFEHQFIATELPDPQPWGYLASVLADLNGNGRLDYVTGVREGQLHWFENREDGAWQRHVLGDAVMRQLGSTGLDVDGDGWIDVVIGRYWYRNPGPPHGRPFQHYQYDSRIRAEIHDIVIADINGDGQPNIVALGDQDGCFWYEVPNDPARDADWPRHTITLDVRTGNDRVHGGFFPNGVADLTGNGCPDIVMPGHWYENHQNGRAWVRHPLPFGRRGQYGLSARSWVVDLNHNGRNDIVMVDCDMPASQAAWLENLGGDPPIFKRHDLPQTAPGARGSFHSLAVADFNGNGRLDVFTVEQEDDTMWAQGATPRWFIWENLGGSPPQFHERVILDNRLGGHDARIGDITGNGLPDIISKVWKPWKENANNGREHVDLLINHLHRPPGE
jgi:hypothetical protein